MYLPSTDFHALFLLRHALVHFASTRLTLRQVLDWAFFVEKHTTEIDWSWLMDQLDRFHMTDFFKCLNRICIDDLGFAPDAFPDSATDHPLKDRVLNDILHRLVDGILGDSNKLFLRKTRDIALIDYISERLKSS